MSTTTTTTTMATREAPREEEGIMMMEDVNLTAADKGEAPSSNNDDNSSNQQQQQQQQPQASSTNGSHGPPPSSQYSNNTNNTKTSVQFVTNVLTTTPLGLWCYRGFVEAGRLRRAERLRNVPIDWWTAVVPYALVRLVLQVAGAAGAVWGAAQVYGLRWQNTDHGATSGNADTLWRPLCLWVVTPLFALRWFWHVKHYLEQDKLDYPVVKRHHRRLHLGSFGQTFAAVFVLQVLGAAGAVWGSLEAWGWRRDDNREPFQIAAALTGVLFAVRFGAKIMDYCLLCEQEAANNTNSSTTTVIVNLFWTTARWLDATATPMLLDVLGSGGAIWGFSEIIGWRHDGTQEEWRIVAKIVTIAFLLRWCRQVVYFVKQERRQKVQQEQEPMATEEQSTATTTPQKRPSTPNYNTMDETRAGVSSPDIELADLQLEESNNSGD